MKYINSIYNNLKMIFQNTRNHIEIQLVISIMNLLLLKGYIEEFVVIFLKQLNKSSKLYNYELKKNFMKTQIKLLQKINNKRLIRNQKNQLEENNKDQCIRFLEKEFILMSLRLIKFKKREKNKNKLEYEQLKMNL